MRKIIFFMLLAPMMAMAQPESTEKPEAGKVESRSAARLTAKNVKNWSLGISFLQWNEVLRLEQAGVARNDVANFNGMAFTASRTVTYYQWGYTLGAFLGSGRANGGGTDEVLSSYDEIKVPWTMMGINPRAFYRFSGRVSFGMTVPVLYKQITWPESDTGITADSGKKLNIIALFDMNVRILNNIDFYQGIGPIGSGTFWQIGLAYRL
jgi:hypothetical protein